MSVSMWESPLRRDGRTSSMSTGRSQDNGGEWDTRRWTLDGSAAAVLGGSSWRPASCRCPHSAHRPAALPTDHWQRALLTTASPSLDSLQQSSPSSSSSSAESSADSSPEKTPATPWTQRPVGYERFHQERDSHTSAGDRLCPLEEAMGPLALCHRGNLERNVRWLANAIDQPSVPVGLSAPKSNCRRGSRRPITGVCVGNTVQVESHLRQSPLAPLAKPRFKPAAKGATAVMCPFCKRNGETPEFYTTHKLKDCWGRVICPVLRAYTCPNCGISGDNAHTLNYCPYK